jgi:hypothetical protein
MGGAGIAGALGLGASSYGAFKFMQLLTTGGGLTNRAGRRRAGADERSSGPKRR